MVLEKTLESPLDCKEIQPVHLKEISPEFSLEGLMLKLKLQYFGHLVQRVSLLRIIHRALLLFIQPPPPLWFSGQWPDEVEKGYKSLDGL